MIGKQQGRNKAFRLHKRYAKMMRRLKSDRLQHTRQTEISQFTGELRPLCACFGESDKRTVGKTYARFADTPHPCSLACCGNPRNHFAGKNALTKQELVANIKEKFERRGNHGN